jgi:hypothetical protein
MARRSHIRYYRRADVWRFAFEALRIPPEHPRPNIRQSSE